MGRWVSLLGGCQEGAGLGVESNQELAWYHAWKRLDSQIAKSRPVTLRSMQLSSIHGQRYQRWQSTHTHLSPFLSLQAAITDKVIFSCGILLKTDKMVWMVHEHSDWWIDSYFPMAWQSKSKRSLFHFRTRWFSSTWGQQGTYRFTGLDVFFHKIHGWSMPRLRWG